MISLLCLALFTTLVIMGLPTIKNRFLTTLKFKNLISMSLKRSKKSNSSFKPNLHRKRSLGWKGVQLTESRNTDRQSSKLKSRLLTILPGRLRMGKLYKIRIKKSVFNYKKPHVMTILMPSRRTPSGR